MATFEQSAISGCDLGEELIEPGPDGFRRLRFLGVTPTIDGSRHPLASPFFLRLGFPFIEGKHRRDLGCSPRARCCPTPCPVLLDWQPSPI